MDSNQRLILTVTLSIAILFGFQWIAPKLGWIPEPGARNAETIPVTEGAVAAESMAGQGGGSRQADAIPPIEPVADVDADAAPAEGAATHPAQARKIPERQVSLRTENLSLRFSNHGAGLIGAELLGRKGQRQGGTDSPQVDFASELQPTDPLFYELDLGEGLPALGLRAPCDLVGSDERSVSFRCQAGTVAVDKKFTVVGDRLLNLDVALHNRGAAPVGGTANLLMPARIDPSRQQSGRGCAGFGGPPPQPTQNICRSGEDTITRHMYKADEPSVTPAGQASFAGIEERYFLAVAVPDKASTCALVGDSPDVLITHLNTPTGTIAPGGSTSFSYQLVVGQKDMGFLQDVSATIASSAKIANPHLDETVDLGFWAVIARILLWMLRAFHHIIHNWGIAIILLTIAVKLLTLPLAWKSMKSMEEMRKLAPEIAALKKKYGDDREKLNVETMKLYQQHKVNPLGGCLPMLIQMPIWLALYTTLQTSVELYNEPFIAGWINDLTSKDPVYALPLAMGVTMYITQRLQPMQVDATQQKMMLYFMPIFFTFIMFQLPAGLTLYIFTNNILSIGQQLVLRKSMGLPAIGAPPASSATIEVAPARKPKKKK